MDCRFTEVPDVGTVNVTTIAKFAAVDVPKLAAPFHKLKPKSNCPVFVPIVAVFAAPLNCGIAAQFAEVKVKTPVLAIVPIEAPVPEVGIDPEEFDWYKYTLIETPVCTN